MAAIEPKKEDREEDPKDKEIRELTEKLHKATTMNKFITGYLMNLGLDLMVMARNTAGENQQVS